MCKSRVVEVDFGLLARLDDEFTGWVREHTITMRQLSASSRAVCQVACHLLASGDVVKGNKLGLSEGLFCRHLVKAKCG